MEALGSNKRPSVHVTIKGHTYPTTIASMGGAFKIPVSAENRALAGVAAGDEVDAEVELDAAPREVALPADFAKELGRDAKSKEFFTALTASQQKAFVPPITDAETPETRARHIEKAITALKECRKRVL